MTSSGFFRAERVRSWDFELDMERSVIGKNTRSTARSQ
jgi:hypothetical protein